jgi:hypothetical protein
MFARLTRHIENNNCQHDHENDPNRFSQPPQVPSDAVQELHQLVVAMGPSTTQFLLVAIAEGQACGYPSKMFAKETLVPGVETCMSLDLCASRLC